MTVPLSPTVLLARPHPFIVAEMAPFLADAGYRVERAHAPEDLDAPHQDVVGAVVSLALTSEMPLSAEAVLRRLRSRRAGLPIVFAALLRSEHGVRAARLVLQASDEPGTVLTPAQSSEAHLESQRGQTFLYFGSSDFHDPELRRRASLMLRHHFR
jgi:hypothetical protein